MVAPIKPKVKAYDDLGNFDVSDEEDFNEDSKFNTDVDMSWADEF